MTVTMTIRVDEGVRARLEKLADSVHRTKSFLAVEAIKEYLKTQEWQINEIKAGIQEADAGEFVSHNEIVEIWEKKRANSMDKKR